MDNLVIDVIGNLFFFTSLIGYYVFDWAFFNLDIENIDKLLKQAKHGK